MKFYRLFNSFKAITFDLDNTLYDNDPVIHKTIIKSHAVLQSYHPKLDNFTLDDYQNLRDQLLIFDPEIHHDVSKWRYRTIELALINTGLPFMEVIAGASKVMRVFHYWRNKAEIPKATHQTLNLLSKSFPLVAITNGNADPKKLGINHYFRFILRAGLHGRAKPWQDMYLLAAKKLSISPADILHVGDDLTTDVVGALNSGMQSCWLNLGANNLMHVNTARLLPHFEISQLDLLMSLL